jgi:acetolactate synthase-1/2/3 large subunit
MNGAESLVQTLINNDLDVCFTNPGTSEMHFVASVGTNDKMRSILTLFEGVATGAADGYGRMLGKPACTLLHLGPGLSNGLANLHNAKRAGSPVVNFIGDHATYHHRFDAPLTSDIHSLANPVSAWVKSSKDAKSLPADGAEAVTASLMNSGQTATLIVPANCAWDESVEPLPKAAKPLPPAYEKEDVIAAAKNLSNGKQSLLFMAGNALSLEGLELADKISQKTGAQLISSTFASQIRRGEGSIKVDRLGYFAEQAEQQLAGMAEMVLVGVKAPVAFFAYPGKSSEFTPEGCNVTNLAQPGHDVVGRDAPPQRRRGVDVPGRDRSGKPGGSRSAKFRDSDRSRCQQRVRFAGRIPDPPARLRPRWLQIHRLRPSRNSPEHHLRSHRPRGDPIRLAVLIADPTDRKMFSGASAKTVRS